MSSTDSGRPAGLLERYFITMQRLKIDSNVVVAGRFHHPSGRHLSVDSVLSAVHHAIQMHAALAMKILNEKGSRFRFVRMPEVRLDQAVRFLGAEDRRGIEEIMEEESTIPIDSLENGPLWRMMVTADDLVIFAWAHPIGDGQSGLAVLRTILEALNRHSNEVVTEVERVVKPHGDSQLTPPVEAITDCSVSFKTLSKELYELIIPPSWRLRQVWSGAKVASEVSTSSRNRTSIISIDTETSTRLLSSARFHKTTLTGVLYIVALSVLTGLISEQPSEKKFKRISTIVAVSLRPLSDLSPKVMTVAVSQYLSYEPVVPMFTWERAASFSKKLQEARPKSREIIGCLKFLFGQYEGYFKSKLGKKRAFGMTLSNLGVFKVVDNGDAEDCWRIGDTYFAQDDRHLGGALKLNVVGSPNGNVNVCVTWGEGAVSEEFAAFFVKGIEKAILELSNDEIKALFTV